MILFPLFATVVIDTGGKLPLVLLTPATTLAKLVEKFAAGVADTGRNFDNGGNRCH
jgi:hypothetical protein